MFKINNVVIRIFEVNDGKYKHTLVANNIEQASNCFFNNFYNNYSKDIKYIQIRKMNKSEVTVKRYIFNESIGRKEIISLEDIVFDALKNRDIPFMLTTTMYNIS